MLALVVRGDRAVGAGEFAAIGHHQRADRGVPGDTICRQRVSRQLGRTTRRFEQSIAQDGIREFIQFAEQSLNAGIDQFIRDAITIAARIDQAGDIVQCATVFSAKEGRAHRLADRAEIEDNFEQAQKDKFLAGDGNIRTAGLVGIGVEEVGRLIHGM